MIQRKDLLALNFYKKSPFTGSDGNMRYRVEKIEQENGDEAPAQVFLQATVWPGPYAFAKTDESKKVRHKADFSDEGLCELTDWMNQQQPIISSHA